MTRMAAASRDEGGSHTPPEEVFRHLEDDFEEQLVGHYSLGSSLETASGGRVSSSPSEDGCRPLADRSAADAHSHTGGHSPPGDCFAKARKSRKSSLAESQDTGSAEHRADRSVPIENRLSFDCESVMAEMMKSEAKMERRKTEEKRRVHAKVARMLGVEMEVVVESDSECRPLPVKRGPLSVRPLADGRSHSILEAQSSIHSQSAPEIRQHSATGHMSKTASAPSVAAMRGYKSLSSASTAAPLTRTRADASATVATRRRVSRKERKARKQSRKQRDPIYCFSFRKREDSDERFRNNRHFHRKGSDMQKRISKQQCLEHLISRRKCSYPFYCAFFLNVHQLAEATDVMQAIFDECKRQIEHLKTHPCLPSKIAFKRALTPMSSTSSVGLTPPTTALSTAAEDYFSYIGRDMTPSMMALTPAASPTLSSTAPPWMLPPTFSEEMTVLSATDSPLFDGSTAIGGHITPMTTPVLSASRGSVEHATDLLKLAQLASSPKKVDSEWPPEIGPSLREKTSTASIVSSTTSSLPSHSRFLTPPPTSDSYALRMSEELKGDDDDDEGDEGEGYDCFDSDYKLTDALIRTKSLPPIGGLKSRPRLGGVGSTSAGGRQRHSAALRVSVLAASGRLPMAEGCADCDAYSTVKHLLDIVFHWVHHYPADFADSALLALLQRLIAECHGDSVAFGSLHIRFGKVSRLIAAKRPKMKVESLLNVSISSLRAKPLTKRIRDAATGMRAVSYQFTDSFFPPPSMVSLLGGKPRLLELSPVIVAEQLTLIDTEIMLHIGIRELTNLSWMKQPAEIDIGLLPCGMLSATGRGVRSQPPLPRLTSPNLVYFIDHVNREALWVCTEILFRRTEMSQVRMTKWFYAAAQRCLQLNNLHSATSIYMGISMNCVQRLRHVKRYVYGQLGSARPKASGTAAARDSLSLLSSLGAVEVAAMVREVSEASVAWVSAIHKELAKVICTERNYKNYREIQQSFFHSDVAFPCLPFMPVVVKDLFVVQSLLVAKDSKDGIKKVDLFLLDKNCRQLRQFREMQERSELYEASLVDSVEVKNQLRMSIASFQEKELLSQRSFKLQPKLTKDDVKNADIIDQLEDFGFL